MAVNRQQRWRLICILRHNDGRRKGKDERSCLPMSEPRWQPRAGELGHHCDWRSRATFAGPGPVIGEGGWGREEGMSASSLPRGLLRSRITSDPRTPRGGARGQAAPLPGDMVPGRHSQAPEGDPGAGARNLVLGATQPGPRRRPMARERDPVPGRRRSQAPGLCCRWGTRSGPRGDAARPQKKAQGPGLCRRWGTQSSAQAVAHPQPQK
uniref:Uncharacterized protein n=1 Tax=Myotis myotis TaxID=51298 RepID=A0A7J7WHX1_MYOMY|nr:hypothetical protein mMyoMyo1_012161 [Myotis myotis]